MAEQSTRRARRRWCRLALLLLIVIALLPEIAIGVVAAVAALKGCQPAQKDACLIAAWPASDIIGLALQAGAGWIVAGIRASAVWLVVAYAAVNGWLVASYIALTLGFARTVSRLVLGLALAAFFAFVPYFGPMLAIAGLANDNCRPNDGGVGPCMIYGGHVGSADASVVHDAVTLGWLAPYGALLALGTFALYAIVVAVSAAARRRRRRAAAS